ncbi:MAG: hypothetical protein J6C96_09350 [Oscillospiraceae bacterium]|nr:hypothetical protein [Oscillospiraceae bacterium]
MTLLITAVAAVVSTAVWYTNEKARKLNVSLLCFMYWGATLMWLVDAAAEYMEAGAAYFTPAAADMINDGFLGLSAAVLSMIIWLVTVLIKDPDGVVRASLSRKE